jgi:hypothetical protein
MNPPNSLLLATFSSLIIVVPGAHADVVTFELDGVTLSDGEPLSGFFDWTYSAGDFEDGSGEFTALTIPHTVYSLADGNLNVDIQADSIEISGNGNYHDVGLDITISPAFSQLLLSPTQSVPIDLSLSFFECCGNGFKDQYFASGSITPVPEPSRFHLYLSGVAGLWLLSWRRRSFALRRPCGC